MATDPNVPPPQPVPPVNPDPQPNDPKPTPPPTEREHPQAPIVLPGQPHPPERVQGG